MTFAASFYFRFRWLHAPASVLMILLQRTPVLRVLAQAEYLIGANASAILRSAFTLAAMGALHSRAGATQLSVSNPPGNPANVTLGNSFDMVLTISGTPALPGSMELRSVPNLPPGLSAVGINILNPNQTSPLVNDGSGGWWANRSGLRVSGTLTTVGSYSFQVSGWRGTNRTLEKAGPYTVTINVTGLTAPVITSPPPATKTVNAGANVSLSVTASGNPAPTYQWLKGTTPLPDQTEATLTLFGVQAGDAGTYYVTASNSQGSDTSDGTVLTVNTPPQVDESPVSQTVTVGDTVIFSVRASGTPAPTFQWQKGIDPLPGETGDTLTLNDIQLGAAGSYSALVTNVVGTTASDPAVLTVKTKFEAWQAAHFTADELTQPTVSGPNAVLLGDGLSNFMKFALGYGPRDQVPDDIFSVQATEGTATFTFKRPAVNPGVTYAVETATDLQTWSATGVTLQLRSSDGTTDTWDATQPAAGTKLFFRLVVTEL